VPTFLTYTRRSLVDLQRDVLNVCNALDVTVAAHEIFGGGDFESFAANVCVARLDLRDHVGEWDAIREQFVGIKIGPVLFDEAPDRRNFRNPFYRGKE